MQGYIRLAVTEAGDLREGTVILTDAKSEPALSEVNITVTSFSHIVCSCTGDYHDD